MNRQTRQAIILDALAGHDASSIAETWNVSKQWVRKVLRLERARRRAAGEDIPDTLYAGRVKVEVRHRPVPHMALATEFVACSIQRAKPDYNQLAAQYNISARSVRREHARWRQLANRRPEEKPERDIMTHGFSPAAADAIASLGPDRVEVSQDTHHFVVSGIGDTGTYIIAADAAHSPYLKEVLIFCGLLFIILITLLYFFTPGA